MIANQLNTTNNTINALIPAPVDGSQFYKYNAGYSAYVFDAYANGGPRFRRLDRHTRAPDPESG